MRDRRTRFSTNRFVLLSMYYPWIVMPYPLRRVVTAAGIWSLNALERIRGIHRQDAATRPEKLFTLSFWGVPDVNPDDYSLTVDGVVNSPVTMVTLDCVGGSRNNATMKGIEFAELLRLAEPGSGAKTAVFHCADGYFTSMPVSDLVETEAFLAYAMNSSEDPDYGYPLRLAAPKKYATSGRNGSCASS